MTGQELFDAVSKDTGMDSKKAKAFCQSMLNIIKNELINGNSVTIPSFGVFETRKREARDGFNPKTREALSIPEKRYPAFRASRSLKNAVKENTEE